MLVYDYRGIGGSRPARLAKLRANWLDWGRLDCEAALRYARDAFPASRSTSSRTASAGSRSLAASNVHVRHAVTVGAQYAYWRDYRPAERRRMWWKWHVVMPVLAAVFGYVPAKRLGWMEDTPRGVALSWVRSQARFEEGYTSGPLAEPAASRAALPARFAGLSAPMLAIGLDDDGFGTVEAIERLVGYYTGSDVTHLRIAPADIGVDAIGHFAFSTAASPKHCGRSRSTGCNTARCQPMRRATCMRFIRHRAGVGRQRRAGRCRERAIGRPRHAWHMPRGHAPALGIDAGGPQRFAISPDRLTSDVSSTGRRTSMLVPPDSVSRLKAPRLQRLDVPAAAARAGVRIARVDFDWRVPLASPAYAALSDGERARAARFMRHEDAVRSAATRAAARRARHGPRHRAAGGGDRRRCIGSAVAGRRASRVARLQRVAGDHALIAWRGVGVDIECCNRATDWRALTREVCAPAESAYLDSLPPAERAGAFMRVWSAKEALLKALGTGIVGGLSAFAVMPPRDGATPRRRSSSRRAAAGVATFDAAWLDAAPGYAACVAWTRA